MIRAHALPTATADGSAGAATALVESNEPINGEIVALYIAQAGSPAATTDITIAIKTPALNVLVLSNVTTSGWYFPRHQVHGSTGTALTLDGTRINADRVPVDGYMTAAIAQGDDNQTLDVTIFVEQ